MPKPQHRVQGAPILEVDVTLRDEIEELAIPDILAVRES